MGQEIKAKIEKLEPALNAVEAELKEWFLKIPNLAKDDVKFGENDTQMT